MRGPWRWGAAMGALLALPGSALAQDPAASRPRFEHRWVYVARNLLVDTNVDDVCALLRRARAAGYTGAVLADYKLTRLGTLPERYAGNVARVRATARELGLALVPCVFPIGYSAGLLADDPNLAEGIPVRDTLFVARGGEARCVAEPVVALRNGDFERVADDGRFPGWDWQDHRAPCMAADDAVKASGTRSLRVADVGAADPRHGHARIVQELAVAPWRCYRLTVRVRTEGLEPAESARVVVLAGDRPLHHQTLGLAATADWQEKRIVFPSLQHDRVRVYLGTWEAKRGRLWWDDARLEEVGLLNVLRRDGCPLRVRGEDGTPYEEARDFEPVADPGLGAKPWPGEYDVDHEPPPIRLRPGGRIAEGARLRVSWYFPPIIHEGQVTCCPADPAVLAWCGAQLGRVRALLGTAPVGGSPPFAFWQHDEIRCLGWDETCRRTSKTPGGMLADHVAALGALMRQAAPGTTACVWSDMFDPHHNARDGYYLVNGTLAGAWEGLPREVVVVNWNRGKARESLRFFAERGHRQIIAGYYDAPVADVQAWLDAAAGVPNVVGVMYTTWANRYDDLEAFARAAWGE